MRYENLKLDDLFLLAKKGDGTAFEHIVLSTEKQIYNLALSITKCREDAEDIAQETYLRLWRSLPDYKGESSAKFYILKIARNLAIDFIRKKAQRSEADNVILTSDGEFEPDIADTDPESRPDESYIRKLKAETLRKCLDELPNSARELIVLRDINGLPYAEIAKMLGITEGTLKSKLFRARERLRQIILSKNIL